jgi:hypothetical protein
MQPMAKTEQIVIDRETLKELVEFMEEAVREGLSKEEIRSQAGLMVDRDARLRLKKSLREVREGRTRHFRNSKELMDDLHSSA